MKKLIFLIAAFVLISTCATAEPNSWGVSFGYGEADPNIDIYRIGVQKDFQARWLENNTGFFSGYFELSYNRWEWQDQEATGVAFSPVFVYYFGNEDSRIRPYIEGGIGVAYIDEYRIADRNLSTHFLFEDRIGTGVKIGFFDINARYLHYSNAGIKQPNHGIDILMLTTSFRF